MEDDQTSSLWSQISGKCLRGKYKDRELTMFASSFSTFGELKDQSGVLFLEKPEKGKAHSPYKEYFEDRSKIGIFGTVASDSLMDPKDKIYGLRSEQSQLAVPVSSFEDQAAQLIIFDKRYILLISDGQAEMAAFNIPSATGTKLDLLIQKDKVILSKEGNTEPLFTFTGIDQTSGNTVEAFPVVTAFWFAWQAFFPMTDIYKN